MYILYIYIYRYICTETGEFRIRDTGFSRHNENPIEALLPSPILSLNIALMVREVFGEGDASLSEPVVFLSVCSHIFIYIYRLRAYIYINVYIHIHIYS